MNVVPREVKFYRTETGYYPYEIWFFNLDDKKTKRLINVRINRIRTGNFGDKKYLGDGVFEIRIHFGPGYRIYYGEENEFLVILLLGGEKRTQINDIKKAKFYWEKLYERKNEKI